MQNNINDLLKEKCSGCGACFNVCPAKAIKMECDDEGFIVPLIDADKCTSCGICSQKCPSMKTDYFNDPEPKLYAVRACDEIRSISSSGGIFTVIAEEIIRRGGYVCGAAFDDELELKHIIIDNTEDLRRLRGSKYVQSNTGKIYSQILDLLKSGKTVFFTGTPCQVAALKKITGDNADLYTMDLICHGVPSQTLFRRYLSEKFPDKNVINIEFRNKKFGWTSNYIRVIFDDGTDYESEAKFDPYVKAFMRNISLRRSCGSCPFSDFPRQGDISAGDFWGISALDKSQTDGKGTSLVYINNDKGASLFDSLKSDLSFREFDFVTTVVRNRIRPDLTINENRQRFHKFLAGSRFSFEKSLSRALTGKYDIGIVSNYYAGNFGGSLTQFALYHTLEDMGYSCLMIERPADSRDGANFETIKQIYIEPPYKANAMARQRKTKKEMEELNNYCDTFVVGSDQLFQYALFNDMGRIATLDWVRNNKKKIAFAASFGHDYIWGDQDVLSEMSFFMRKFDAFSVREKSGIDLCHDEFGVEAEWVLDPVFLCDPKYYDELIDKADIIYPEHYIASYILDPSKDKAMILKTAEKQLGLKAKIFSEFGDVIHYASVLSEEGLDVEQLKVEERLKLIKNCDFFISDSFHGTCLAIIMGKPFITVINKKRGGSRFESLLAMFGLTDRMICDSNDLNDNTMIFGAVDYSRVERILSSERERCLKWLYEAIIKEKKRDKYSDYDVLIRIINEQRDQIEKLNKKIEYLGSKIGFDLDSITDIFEYIDKIEKDKEKYIVFMSVKDTVGMSLSRNVADALKSLGVKNDLVNKHWNSFGCIIDSGKNIFEQIGPGRVRKNLDLYGNNCWVVSANYKLDNVSKIIINKKEYSVNKRGLNIVVWDKENNTLIDSVCFDMHLKKYVCFRK